MATKQGWGDRRELLSLFEGLDNCLANFKIFYERLDEFKTEVLDDPARKTQMKKLIDEDENWTIATIQTKINKLKTIYNYLNQ